MKVLTAQTRWLNRHCSQDVVDDFERAILFDTDAREEKGNERIASLFKKIYRRLAHLKTGKLDFVRRAMLSSPRLTIPRDDSDYFVVLMNLDMWKCLPLLKSRGHKSAYFFDAWPHNFHPLRRFIRDLGLDTVFTSSSQAADMLNECISNCRFHWIPEGIDMDIYGHHDYEKKDIDILQMGRRYDAYHQHILSVAAEVRKTYVYEQDKTQIIFPTRQEFVEAMSRTKISVCFPQNITHPEIAGDIETMTNRYLQSMASKCLVLGKAPREMIELFGYNPVVEVDMDQPAKQLKTILTDFDKYMPLIEKNHKNMSNHTWKKRWEEIQRIVGFPGQPKNGHEKQLLT